MLLVVLPGTDPYVTLNEIRALPNLGDTAKFTDFELTQAREWFETTFEGYVGMAFVPRTATERLSGGRSTLMLKRWPVRSVQAVRSFTTATVSTAFTAAELADLLIDPTGEIRRYSSGTWPADVEVDYTHGQLAPPADVKRAALIAIQERLLEDHSGRPTDRTYGTATDGVFIRSILPGADKPFGLAGVDEVANRYRAKYWVPAVA